MTIENVEKLKANNDVYYPGTEWPNGTHDHSAADLMMPQCSVITRKMSDNHSSWSGITTDLGKSTQVHWTLALKKLTRVHTFSSI